MIRVAVIGGGAAGLCAARYLTSKPEIYRTVVYEQTDQIGGTWVYREEVGTDKYGQPIHSSMYSRLRTNLPKEVMMFPDVPITYGGKTSFITHQETLQYLQHYADKFELHQYIQLLTRVESVKPIKTGDKTEWEVIVKSVESPDSVPQVNQFDAVLLCNGHYSVPRKPAIPGLDSFTGKQLHSHEYRHPEDYTGQSVVVLGAGNSGLDISIDLHEHAKKIYLSHLRPKINSTFPNNLVQVPGIDRIMNDDIAFTDGQIVSADALILCTGYHYNFPFLTPECEVTVDDNRVTPLFKHVIHTTYPSLSILGIPLLVLPFPLISCQVQLVMAVLEGTASLPSKAEMDADTQREYDFRRTELKMAHRHAHKMGAMQWSYCKDLLRLANVDSFINPVIKDLYDEVSKWRGVDLLHYKNFNYEFTGGMTGWKHVESSDKLNSCES